MVSQEENGFCFIKHRWDIYEQNNIVNSVHVNNWTKNSKFSVQSTIKIFLNHYKTIYGSAKSECSSCRISDREYGQTAALAVSYQGPWILLKSLQTDRQRCGTYNTTSCNCRMLGWVLSLRMAWISRRLLICSTLKEKPITNQNKMLHQLFEKLCFY